jgi:hypothetical protein
VQLQGLVVDCVRWLHNKKFPYKEREKPFQDRANPIKVLFKKQSRLFRQPRRKSLSSWQEERLTAQVAAGTFSCIVCPIHLSFLIFFHSTPLTFQNYNVSRPILPFYTYVFSLFSFLNTSNHFNRFLIALLSFFFFNYTKITYLWYI